MPRGFSVLSWGCLLYPLFASNPESGCLFFLGVRFSESCDDSDCEPLVAFACFILDTIWYSFLSLICYWVFDRRTYLSFAFSSFCLDLFYRLLFLCCICLRRQRLQVPVFWNSHSGGVALWTYSVPCIYATESWLASLLGSRGDDIGLVLQHASLPTSP